RTIPPAGQPRLEGADASHAWVAVWDPVFSWVDFDPTNDIVPGLDHITLAWGRDFADVSPVSGLVVGGGGQTLSVGVDVRPLLTEAV
ncbi:MAG: transglutaminase family protein, partial [Pseudomonadota bacterium]